MCMLCMSMSVISKFVCQFVFVAYAVTHCLDACWAIRRFSMKRSASVLNAFSERLWPLMMGQ